jgi:hypothetical protein
VSALSGRKTWGCSSPPPLPTAHQQPAAEPRTGDELALPVLLSELEGEPVDVSDAVCICIEPCKDESRPQLPWHCTVATGVCPPLLLTLISCVQA